MYAQSETNSSQLDALNELAILDTIQEKCYDDIIEIAACICDVPIALLAFADAERQWFKANKGMTGVVEVPSEISFCTHTIEQGGVLEINDALHDPRFSDSPLVIGPPHIRFYAGVPLHMANGAIVGSLCVIDNKAKRLSKQQRRMLQLLSTTLVQILEARVLSNKHAASETRFRALSEASPLGIFSANASGACTYANDRWHEIFGTGYKLKNGFGWSRSLHPEDRQNVLSQWRRATAMGIDFDMSFRLQLASGEVPSVRVVSRPVLAANGLVSGHVGSVENITKKNQQLEELRKNETLIAETGAMADVGGWELEISTCNFIWTDQMFAIHDLPAGDQPSLKQAISLYTKDSQVVLIDAYKHAISTGTGWDLELSLMSTAGTTIWVRSVGHIQMEQQRPVRLIGAVQNITQRVLKTKELDDAHKKISIATESGEIGVWDWNIDTNELEWSPQMFALYGFPKQIGNSDYARWAGRVHPEDKSTLENTLAFVKGSKATSLENEFRVIWPDGSVHHIRAAARVFRDEQGTATRVLGVNWDVTALCELRNELARQHELLQVTLQSIGDAVITTDIHGCVTWLNPVAVRMTGWPVHLAAGKQLLTVFNIIHESTGMPAADPIAHCLNDSHVTVKTRDIVLVSRTGIEFGIENSAAPIKSNSDELLGVILVFHDVSKQRQLTKEMQHRAMHDMLTGLVNRSEFEHRLLLAFHETTRKGCEHTLLYVDLDQFKLINDSCGHAKGDQLLSQIADLIRRVASYKDTIARIGGDEFALIIRNCGIEKATMVAQSICDAMNDFHFIHENRRFRLGTSIGVVCLDQRWNSIEPAMQAADLSCYAAKKEGRNRVHVWQDTDVALQQRKENTKWAVRIEQALDEGLFELHAQLICATDPNIDSLNAEILIRMRGKNNQLLHPNNFIGAAERFCLASRIDRWVLEETIHALSKHSGVTRINTLFVNLSGQSVGDPVFHADAIELLTNAGTTLCNRICLEITETAAVTNMEAASRFVDHVRSLGVQVALDDFGAGASSFGYLKTLKVDILKIDGQFMNGVVDNALDSAAVRCFVDVANVMGIQTVAEYVSNEEILDCVSDMGVDYVQGFYLHQPEPIEQAMVSSPRLNRVAAVV